jgi:hypothetical protein
MPLVFLEIIKMAVDINKGEFLTPVLRLVQGDCFEAQTKKMDGSPLIGDDGKPYVKYFIAAAGRKGDPAVEAFKAQIEAQARKDFAHLFPGGVCSHPRFSYKISDGDGHDDNGKSNAAKEGFAGHWVFRFSTGYPPKCYAAGKYDPMTDQLHPVNGLNPIPRGYYIRVNGVMKGNGNALKPGVYVFHNLIEFAAPGNLIVSGPDASSVFGGGAAAPAPQAAYAPPPPQVAVAPAAPAFTMTALANGLTREQYIASGWTDAALLSGGYMFAAAPVAPPAPPAAAMAPPPPQQVAVAPHPGILAPLPPGGSAPPPPPPAPIAAAAPGFKMSNPVGTSYAAYIAAGWSDATLVQNGHMVPV